MMRRTNPVISALIFFAIVIVSLRLSTLVYAFVVGSFCFRATMNAPRSTPKINQERDAVSKVIGSLRMRIDVDGRALIAA